MDLAWLSARWLGGEADIALTPWENSTTNINRVSCIIRASDFVNLIEMFAFICLCDLLRVPMSLLITKSNLAVSVETPRIKSSWISQSDCVSKTSRASLNVHVVFWELNLFWSSYFSKTTQTQLTHFSFTPTEHFSFVCYCKGVICTCSNMWNKLSMEVLNESWNWCNFNCFWQTKLTLKSTAPSI